ncbi:MAG: hypothetical protein WCV91_00695 [Candidatus Margulisiibacteriota bacterium]
MKYDEPGKDETLEKVYWVISIRYVAVAIAFVLGLIFLFSYKNNTPAIGSGIFMTLCALFYNSLGFFYFKKNESKLSNDRIITLSFYQLLADVMIITFLVHATGGILSPFVLLYIVIISIIAPEKTHLSELMALFIIMVYMAFLALDYYGVLSPVIFIEKGKDVYQDFGLLFYYLVGFPLFVIFAVFLSASIAGYLTKGKVALAEHVTELNHTKLSLENALKEVENKNQEVSGLNDNLKEKIKELENFHDFSVGRELKMIELEQEIEKLKEQHK